MTIQLQRFVIIIGLRQDLNTFKNAELDQNGLIKDASLTVIYEKCEANKTYVRCMLNKQTLTRW